MAELIPLILVSLCIAMVILGVEGHGRWATECAVFFFALLPMFFTPNPRLLIYPFLLYAALVALAERFVAARKKRRVISIALPVLTLLALAAWSFFRRAETDSNWPLLGVFLACVFFHALMRRGRFLAAFPILLLGVFTLILWSREIKTVENKQTMMRNWRPVLEQNPNFILPPARCNMSPEELKPPPYFTNPKPTKE